MIKRFHNLSFTPTLIVAKKYRGNQKLTIQGN